MTAQCPQCGRVHAAAPGRGAALKCSNCNRVWTTPDAGSEPLRCVEHPGRRAAWVCAECGKPHCGSCVTTKGLQEREIRVSTCCEGNCLPVAQIHQPRRFHEDLGGLFLYPLRIKGLVIFGFVFAGLMLPLLNLLTYLFLAGYLVHVLTTSANGGKHLPDFPEFKNIWHGLLVPCGLLAFTFVLSNAPLIFYVRLAGQDASLPLVWLLTGVAVVVFPIIAMTTVITRSVVDALNFFNLLRIVRAIGNTYRLLVVYLAGILAVQYAVTSILDQYELLVLLELFIQVYTWFVVAHLLGRAIHETRGQVEWDS